MMKTSCNPRYNQAENAKQKPNHHRSPMMEEEEESGGCKKSAYYSSNAAKLDSADLWEANKLEKKQISSR